MSFKGVDINKLRIVFYVFIFGVFLFLRNNKSKEEYYKVSGIVSSIEKYFPAEKKSKNGKLRYIKIDSHKETFRVFIGKDFTDFSPNFESIDSLEKGDLIDVFYGEKTPFQKSRIDLLNYTVQFIEKNNKPYFIRGRKDEYGASFFISVAILIAVILWYEKVYLKRNLSKNRFSNEF